MIYPTFENGALAQLRSGGPTMVVVVDPNADASGVPMTQCCWLDGNLRFQWRSIPTAALRPAGMARGPGVVPIARLSPAGCNSL